jgi:hypothetical protein
MTIYGMDTEEWYYGSIHDMTAPLDALTLAQLGDAYHRLGKLIDDPGPGPGVDVAAAVRRRDAIRESMDARGDDQCVKCGATTTNSCQICKRTMCDECITWHSHGMDK